MSMDFRKNYVKDRIRYHEVASRINKPSTINGTIDKCCGSSLVLGNQEYSTKIRVKMNIVLFFFRRFQWRRPITS